MSTTTLGQLRFELDDFKARQTREMFGRFVDPPYRPTTVKREVGVLISYCSREGYNLNHAQEYAEYLQKRFPRFDDLQRKVEERLTDHKAIGQYLRGLLKTHDKFVKNRRKEVRWARTTRLLDKCHLCAFDYRPLLQLHHLIPLSEGGDNQALVVLCPLCHAGIHELTRATRQAMTRKDRRAFEWWQENQDDSSWWARAGEGITYLTHLYLEYHESNSYDAFVNELSQKELEIPVFSLGKPSRPRELPLLVPLRT